MQIKKADELVNKSMKVILSCKTLEQLNVALEYSKLLYKKLSGEVSLSLKFRYLMLIERSIGFAQCQIKQYQEPCGLIAAEFREK